jgi:predicted nucleotidyltransferase
VKTVNELKIDIVNCLSARIDGLEAVYIFGSYGDGTATSKSDIDIAFLSSTPCSTLELWEDSKALALQLGLDVDLIDIKTTHTVFRYQILSKGIRIFANDLHTVEAFESLAYSFYLRFNEERQPIIDAILADKKVYRAV